jgi:outer membrane protein assembly factor BamB
MRFEIVVARPVSAPSPGPSTPASHPESGLRLVPREARRTPTADTLDIFVDGTNVMAHVRETHGAFVLRDLALALVDLARRPRAKATVRLYDEPWELCIERFGATACLSLYRTGADPIVAVHDRAVPFDEVVAGARDAVVRLLGDASTTPASRVELGSALTQLESSPPASAWEDIRVPPHLPVVVEPDRDAPLSFGAEFSMRPGAPATAPDHAGRAPYKGATASETVERTDLHALLFRGRVRAEIRGRAVDLGEAHPVLVAERLVDLARRAFDAWERGLPLYARGDAAGVLVGVRVSADGELALTLGASTVSAGTAGRARDAARPTAHTFPALGVTDVLEAALAFGRSLVRAILRRDRAQSNNLRLGALRRALREGNDALRAASQTDSMVNPSPEPYRAFAAALDESRGSVPSGAAPSGTAPAAARLRYAARWRAIVPGIDLRATYLCGDRLVVGAATEMWALDRANGRVLWRTDVSRGTSVVTPGGIARLAPDGALCVHDFGTGEVTMRARIAPRTGGPVAGAVVHLPGLPKLVVVTEGEHHLVAIDLTTGEPRWRWSWGGGGGARGGSRGAPRMKRAGRLVFFACGDGALTALDVMTGAVVWRLRDRLRFRVPPTVAHDALFVVAGGAHGVASLYCVDPFSGDVRWSRRLADASAPCTVEGAPLVAGGAVAVAVRQKSGLLLAPFRRDTGEPIPTRVRVVAPTGTSWLAVDDAFIGNTPNGELVALDAATGEVRWRHVLCPRPLEADVPRRLEPVLRSGALFVPHTDVSIVRPGDGALLGTIAPTEAIPDMLRVDERCDVYVAEESGHLVSFGGLPRLSLVSR